MRDVLLAGLAVLAAGCSFGGENAQAQPSGTAGGERSYQVAAFQTLQVKGPYDVQVRQGSQTSVRAAGAEALLDNLVVRVEGNALVIESREGFSWSGRDRGATVYVTTPNLTAAALAGSGDVSVDRIAGARFEAALAGSGNLRIDQVDVRALEASIAGSGDIRLAGRAETADINIVGSGDVDAGGVASRTASISIAGSGSAVIEARETADVAVRGSGDVTVTGGARCSVSKAGSGSVRCG